MAGQARMGATVRVGWMAVVVVALTVVGCGVFERWACGEPCTGGVSPADGTIDDFTLGGRDEAGVTITEATFCETIGDQDSHVVFISTRGQDASVDVGDWVGEHLVPQLDARGIAPAGRGRTVCADHDDEDGVYVGFLVTDWAAVDPIVETIVELAERDDISAQFVVTIEPHVSLCPDDACGY